MRRCAATKPGRNRKTRRLRLPPAPARLANKPNPLLVKLCHLLFRLALVLCAVPLIVSGIQAMRAGYTGWPLLVSGLFVLCAEFLFKWFDRLEKMK